jgi:hypothetical protein
MTYPWPTQSGNAASISWFNHKTLDAGQGKFSFTTTHTEAFTKGGWSHCANTSEQVVRSNQLLIMGHILIWPLYVANTYIMGQILLYGHCMGQILLYGHCMGQILIWPLYVANTYIMGQILIWPLCVANIYIMGQILIWPLSNPWFEPATFRSLAPRASQLRYPGSKALDALVQ